MIKNWARHIWKDGMVRFRYSNSLLSKRRFDNMPVHTYTNWNKRQSDTEEQREPFRKYFFICEGANTETFYFKRLIDMRKELGIFHLPRILWILHLNRKRLRIMDLMRIEIRWLLKIISVGSVSFNVWRFLFRLKSLILILPFSRLKLFPIVDKSTSASRFEVVP